MDILTKIKCLLCFTSILCADGVHVITMSNYPSLGMFATANQVLGCLSLFETGQLPGIVGVKVDFGLNGLYYDSDYGPNWWSYFFEPINIGESKNVEIIGPSKFEYSKAWERRRQISRRAAAELVNKYIHIKPHIQKKVNDFIESVFKDNFIIGVHYRGTDKRTEAPRVEYLVVFKEIEKQLQKHDQCLIFVATDEIEFMDEIKSRYPNQVIETERHRAHKNGLGSHKIHKQQYEIGEEALLDSFLLSKTNLLIRTSSSSSLSLWSTYFNPNLPVILLNKRNIMTLEPE